MFFKDFGEYLSYKNILNVSENQLKDRSFKNLYETLFYVRIYLFKQNIKYSSLHHNGLKVLYVLNSMLFNV